MPFDVAGLHDGALPGDKRIRSLHKDCAAEYDSLGLREWARKRDVQLRFSRPYESNSNAIAERAIRTLEDQATRVSL